MWKTSHASHVIRPSFGSDAAEITFVRPQGTSVTLSHKLLLVFIVLLYAIPSVVWPELEPYAPTQVVGILVVLMMIAERLLSHRGFYFVWPESYLLMFFLAAAGLSSFSALWPRHALLATVELAKMVAIYVVIVNSVRSEKQLRMAMWAMVIGGLAPALGALHHYTQEIFIEGDRVGWLGTYGNPNDLAYALIVLLPLAFALSAGAGVWRRVALGTIAITYLAAIFLTYSRGGLLALFVVAGFILLRERSGWARILSVLLVIGALVFVTSFWARDESFTNITEDLTLRQRIATIEAGLAMFFADPLLGVGIDCSMLGWPLYGPGDIYTQHWLHLHNTFVQVLSETGLLGFIPFALLLILSLRRARLVARRTTAAKRSQLARAAEGLEVGLWGFLAAGLSGGQAWSWFPYLVIGLISASWTIAKESDSEDTNGESTQTGVSP